MATYFIDIDGTIVNFHTNILFDGVLNKLKDINNKGHQIIFITMRGVRDSGSEWSKKNTKEKLLPQLDNAGIKYQILYDIESPRILIDDFTHSKTVIVNRDGSFWK